MREDCPHASRRSSACGASSRTFSQPGTALATPVLKSEPLTTAAGNSEVVGLVVKAWYTSSCGTLSSFHDYFRKRHRVNAGQEGPTV